MCSQSLHVPTHTCRLDTKQTNFRNNKAKENFKRHLLIYANQKEIMRQEEGNYITIRWYQRAGKLFLSSGSGAEVRKILHFERHFAEWQLRSKGYEG